MADKKVVIGVFKTQEEAIEAIKGLQRNGFEDDEISVLTKKRKNIDKIKDDTHIKVKTESLVEGAAGGAVTGGVIGGAGALLAELGLIAIPGVGPLLAAGPIAATLAGLAAGGVVGGTVGALVDLGLNRDEAKKYSEYLDKERILVMVEEDDKRKEYAYETFDKYNSMTGPSYNKERNLYGERAKYDNEMDKHDSINDRLEKQKRKDEKVMPPPDVY